MRTMGLTIRKFVAAFVMAALVMPPVAWAEEPAPPNVDAAMQQLMQLKPEELAEKIKAMKANVTSADAEATKLDEQAKAKANEAKALKQKLEILLKGVDALAATTKMADPKPADKEKMMGGGDAVMADAKEMAKAEEAAAPTVTYDDHILPIFESRCNRCHNDDRARGGLSLTSFNMAMTGGSSGEVIQKGNPDGSRLLRLAMQVEEPKMPPSGDPLSAEELDLIRKWIQLGAPQNSTSKVMVAKETDVGSGEAYIAADIADTPPMPEKELPPAVATASRGVVARAVATSPTAPIAAVGGDRQVLVYNLSDFSVMGALPFPEGDIYTMTFSVNGEMLLAAGGHEGDSGIAVIWHVRSTDRVGTYGQAYDTILAADISPDNRIVALGGPNKKVRTYSVADGSELFSCEKHTDWIYSVRFTPDGEVLATADRAGGMYLWQAENGRYVEQLRGHNGAIHDLSYSADSKVLASAGEDGTVRLWDTWKFNQIRSIGGVHSGPVHSVHFDPSGEMVTCGQDGQIFRINTNGEKVGTYEKFGDWAYQVRFGRNAEVVLAGAWNGHVVAFDRASAERKADFGTQPIVAEEKPDQVAKATD